MQPIVTVIMPVAIQHVKYLPDALMSLNNQTIQAHQTIVVNDTGKPLRVNDGAKVLNTKGHEGASIARNIGIDATTTPFIFFLDADDLAVNTVIESCVRAYASQDYTGNYLFGDSIHNDDYMPALKYDRRMFPLYPQAIRNEWWCPTQYDRPFILRNNLHTVSAFVPTDSIKAIGGFDEQVPGWEDWELYIRLGINGYCGEHLPMPTILYRVNTGINRNAHYFKWEQIFADVNRVYGDYQKGILEPMACCGKNAKAQQAAQQFVNTISPDTVAGDEVVFEYLGNNQGAIPFRMRDGTIYRGASNPTNRFTKVQKIHAQELYERGNWRQVPNSVLKARKPDMPETIQPNPVLPTPPPMPQVEIKMCVECGHVQNFHGVQGCQALEGNQICGCEKYQEEKPELPKARKVRKVKA